LPRLVTGSMISEFGIWHLLVLVGFAVICVAVWRLPGRVRAAIDVEDNLGRIEAAAQRASRRVVELDRRLEVQARTDYRRSVIQTLFGTLIGLLGGYSAGWVDEGGVLFPDGALGRVAVVSAVGVLIVLLAPVLLFPHVDRFLIWVARLRQRP
jgi:hypothetical protein